MDKPLRLLVAGVAWPLETFIERLLRGLAANGMHITLATPYRPDVAWLAQTGIEWLPSPTWQGPSLNSFAHLAYQTLRGMSFAARDTRVLLGRLPHGNWKTRLSTWYNLSPFTGRRWDVIYFPWNSAAVLYMPLFDLKIPVVLSCRGSQINIAPHNTERKPFLVGLQKTLKRATLVHCVSNDILKKSIRLGLDENHAVVIRPAIDPDYFMPPLIMRPRNDIYKVIMVGSLTWVKGYEYALSAIRQLIELGVPVSLGIIGDGPEKNRVQYTIEDLGLNAHVQLVGKCSPAQIRSRLQAADVFLLSSLSEGISNAALEAMACGLPVVTTDCGGMREAVTDGVEGLIVPVRDPASIEKALMNLWEHPEKRKQMGSAARNRVLKEFQLKDQIDKWFHLLLNVRDI
jgi:colanic acid/amylovoran biosynthesis glycosyltransferase